MTIRSAMRMTSIILKRALGINRIAEKGDGFCIWYPLGGVYDAVVEHMYATGCGTGSEMTMIALEEDF
jgi:hypothetical protein